MTLQAKECLEERWSELAQVRAASRPLRYDNGQEGQSSRPLDGQDRLAREGVGKDLPTAMQLATCTFANLISRLA
jgi:hypothetical protein